MCVIIYHYNNALLTGKRIDATIKMELYLEKYKCY